jgi:glycosyltransferase involved in cell wall biosynthesis
VNPPPIVSVVIPCHNHGRFLREAAESVQRQTLAESEIVVVDDGSTDDTPVVAASLPGIRYLRQDNRGASAARNTGWQHSRAPFLVFLDADDRLRPNALQAGVDHARAHPDAAFVAGNYVFIDAAGRERDRAKDVSVTDDLYRELLRVNFIGMLATVVYRREALDRFGGFDPSLRGAEDYDLYLRMARQAPAFCHPEYVAEYRHHGANASNDNALMLSAAIDVLRRQRRHVRGRPAHEQAYREGLALWRRVYGELLLDDFAMRVVRRASWGPTLRMLGVLLRYHPAGLARRVRRMTLRLGRAAPHR